VAEVGGGNGGGSKEKSKKLVFQLRKVKKKGEGSKVGGWDRSQRPEVGGPTSPSRVSFIRLRSLFAFTP
jgi:hypothetical protein